MNGGTAQPGEQRVLSTVHVFLAYPCGCSAVEWWTWWCRWLLGGVGVALLMRGQPCQRPGGALILLCAGLFGSPMPTLGRLHMKASGRPALP
jgi:hypothetical protein